MCFFLNAGQGLQLRRLVVARASHPPTYICQLHVPTSLQSHRTFCACCPLPSSFFWGEGALRRPSRRVFPSQVVSRNVARMNGVNLATAFHRLARAEPLEARDWAAAKRRAAAPEGEVRFCAALKPWLNGGLLVCWKHHPKICFRWCELDFVQPQVSFLVVLLGRIEGPGPGVPGGSTNYQGNPFIFQKGHLCPGHCHACLWALSRRFSFVFP